MTPSRESAFCGALPSWCLGNSARNGGASGMQSYGMCAMHALRRAVFRGKASDRSRRSAWVHFKMRSASGGNAGK